jgi:hypothetical protein
MYRGRGRTHNHNRVQEIEWNYKEANDKVKETITNQNVYVEETKQIDKNQNAYVEELKQIIENQNACIEGLKRTIENQNLKVDEFRKIIKDQNNKIEMLKEEVINYNKFIEEKQNEFTKEYDFKQPYEFDFNSACVNQMRNIIEQIMQVFPESLISIGYGNGGSVFGRIHSLTPSSNKSVLTLTTVPYGTSFRIPLSKIASIRILGESLIDENGGTKIKFLDSPSISFSCNEAQIEEELSYILESFMDNKTNVNITVGGISMGYLPVKQVEFGVAVLGDNTIIATNHVDFII